MLVLLWAACVSPARRKGFLQNRLFRSRSAYLAEIELLAPLVNNNFWRIFSLRSDEKSRFPNFCCWSVGSSWCWCLQRWFGEPLFFLKEWSEISLLEHQAHGDSREAISLTSFSTSSIGWNLSVRRDQKSRSCSAWRMYAPTSTTTYIHTCSHIHAHIHAHTHT